MSFEAWKENFNREKIRLGTYYKECWNAAQIEAQQEVNSEWIERCKRFRKQDADYREAEMREPGPCGKPGHLKANWVYVKDSPQVSYHGDAKKMGHCSICEEIRLAVEKALAEQATTNRMVRTGPSHTQWYGDKPAGDTKLRE